MREIIEMMTRNLIRNWMRVVTKLMIHGFMSFQLRVLKIRLTHHLKYM